MDAKDILGLGAAMMFLAAVEARSTSGRITFAIVGLLLAAAGVLLYLADKGRI